MMLLTIDGARMSLKSILTSRYDVEQTLEKFSAKGRGFGGRTFADNVRRSLILVSAGAAMHEFQKISVLPCSYRNTVLRRFIDL